MLVGDWRWIARWMNWPNYLWSVIQVHLVNHSLDMIGSGRKWSNFATFLFNMIIGGIAIALDSFWVQVQWMLRSFARWNVSTILMFFILISLHHNVLSWLLSAYGLVRVDPAGKELTTATAIVQCPGFSSVRVSVLILLNSHDFILPYWSACGNMHLCFKSV